MPQTLSTAREVAEILMERSRRALLDNDYEEFLQCFALPVEIETFDGRRWLKSLNTYGFFSIQYGFTTVEQA